MAKSHWFDFPCGDILKELQARKESGDQSEQLANAIAYATKAFEVEVNNPDSPQVYFAREELHSALAPFDAKNAAIVQELLNNHGAAVSRFDVERESYGGTT